jgi:hypothetical protein
MTKPHLGWGWPCAVASHDQRPVVLVGNGTLPAKRHLKLGRATPLTTSMHLLLDRMGVQAKKVGDSTGRMARI